MSIKYIFESIKHRLYRKMHPMKYIMISNSDEFPFSEIKDEDVIYKDQLEKPLKLDKELSLVSFTNDKKVLKYICKPEISFETKMRLGVENRNGYKFTKENFEPFLDNERFSVVGLPDENEKRSLIGSCSVSEVTDEYVKFEGTFEEPDFDYSNMYLVPGGFGTVSSYGYMEEYNLDVLMLSKTQSGIISTSYDNLRVKPARHGLFKKAYCQNCGEPLDKNSEKCDFCGQYIDWS